MKIGLLGFGKAGKAVANVILQHKDFSLEWVLKKTDTLNKLSAKDILGISASDDAVIYSQNSTDIETLLEDHPVDFVIDFSNEESIHLYGKFAARKKIKIISAISHYGENEIRVLKELATDTVVFW